MRRVSFSYDSTYSDETNMSVGAERATNEKFVEALKQVPDSEPPEYHRLPEGYVRHW